VRFLRKGKVKEVYEVSDQELEFLFTDQISVFDKVIPTLVPHKGETLCRTSAHCFRAVGDLGEAGHREPPAAAALLLALPVVDGDGCMTVLPHVHGCDGAFAARFRKT